MRFHRSPQSWLVALLALGGGHLASAQSIPDSVRQLIVSVAPGWDSTQGVLRQYERGGAGQPWKAVGERNIPVLYGRNGLAWGLGVLPAPTGRNKIEKDGRAPAGCFAIGIVYGYAGKLPKGSEYPYRQVSLWDAWPDDPENPHYNQHIVINPKQGVPAWFEKQKMRHNDPAYNWLIEVRHNSDPVRKGAGSAIFMHTRRGPTRPTAGCTTMTEEDLISLIRWLRADQRPHYVLLPRAEYDKLRPQWGLPPAP